MRKQTPSLILCFLWLLVGLLLGYYFGSEYSLRKSTQAPYMNQPTPASACNALTNITPIRGTKITSPLTVSVTVDNTKSCKWTVFEAQAGTLTLTDSTGQTLGTGTLKTSDNWMTNKPVIYTGIIQFSKPITTDLTLTIHEENPNSKENKVVTIPLTY